MANYSIKYVNLQNEAASFQGVGRDLRAYVGKLAAIDMSMAGRYPGMAELKEQVKSCSEEVSALADSVAALDAELAAIVEIYAESEKGNHNGMDASATKAAKGRENAVLAWINKKGAASSGENAFASWCKGLTEEYQKVKEELGKVVKFVKNPKAAIDEWGNRLVDGFGL
jgi:hypothetical protein